MLTFLPRTAYWKNIPPGCRASFMEACPEALRERLSLLGRVGNAFSEAEIRAILKNPPQVHLSEQNAMLRHLGDDMVEVLLEPESSVEWLEAYLGSRSSYPVFENFAAWVLKQGGPPTTEAGLQKTAAFTKKPLPDNWVGEDDRVEFLHKVGAPAASQILAHSWPEITDDVAWDILAGGAADHATQVANKEWYRVAGWHHIATILTYRKDLFLKALEEPGLAKFCPHALWWEDSYADNLPGVDWDTETCSPSTETADLLLSLLWVPASTPQRARSIRSMALQHQGLSQKWGTLASAAKGRLLQGRPAIKLSEIGYDQREMLAKMIRRCQGKGGIWPKRFPEIAQLAMNPTVDPTDLPSGVRRQLEYTIPETPLFEEVQRFIDIVPPLRHLDRYTTKPTKTRMGWTHHPELDATWYPEFWVKVSGWDNDKQVRFWRMLDALVETADDNVDEYAKTAVALLEEN
mgnify:CR=1 FL=1